MTAMESETPEHAGRIAAIAKAVRDAYGDDATVVAERQIEAADAGNTRADWIAILEWLRAPANRR